MFRGGSALLIKRLRAAWWSAATHELGNAVVGYGACA
jgi:hypothetical protein